MPQTDACADLQALPGSTAFNGLERPHEMMVTGIHRHLDRLTRHRVKERCQAWDQAPADACAAASWLEGKRRELGRLLGAVDPRCEATLSCISDLRPGQPQACYEGVAVYSVRWRVFADYAALGLLLEPPHPSGTGVVLLPDCDQLPESVLSGGGGDAPGVFLAKLGCRVLVPCLLSRDDAFSGNPRIRMTNQPHREFVYRAAFEVGRHVIGMELQQVFAGIDWLVGMGARRIGVAGYGEGGMLAFYASALDTRVSSCCVSGFTMKRETLWKQPIYRNVFALLNDYGDAEVACLAGHCHLLVEASRHPDVSGPPAPREGRQGAAPGRLGTPAFAEVSEEYQRACLLRQCLVPMAPPCRLFGTGSGHPWQDDCVREFAAVLGLSEALSAPSFTWSGVDLPPDASRQEQCVESAVALTQRWLREAEFRRDAYWRDAAIGSHDVWMNHAPEYRRRFWEEIIGKLPPATVGAGTHSRLVSRRDAFAVYEVMLGVWDDVFAYGVLLLPNDLQAGEKRPVVVCQHGLEGTPEDVYEPTDSESAYHCYAARLAERGFIVYAPQNPYKGGDAFRSLQRKLNPLGYTLFSVIVRQHEVALEWLRSLACVDQERIAFYGISYGGKTAMRVPAILEGYCLSICSADYNEWIWKNASSQHGYSYLFTGEYEMPEFDLGNTFNYAEMARLIYPRPFMVERGHHDGVAPDEWVAYEYARAQRFYDLLGRGEFVEMEVFDGPHCIHGEGSFRFLHRHLCWPGP